MEELTEEEKAHLAVSCITLSNAYCRHTKCIYNPHPRGRSVLFLTLEHSNYCIHKITATEGLNGYSITGRQAVFERQTILPRVGFG